MKKNNKAKLWAFTGGHHTPAIALIDQLLQEYPGLKIIWFGHKHSLRGDPSISLEYKEITARGYQFIDLKATKIYRVFDPRQWLKFPCALCQAFFSLLKHSPQIVVSFGGYLAVPVVLSAWILRIPVISHEQTVTAGWANRFLSRLSRAIFISWIDSARYFPPSKTYLVGNPIRHCLLKDNPHLQQYLDKNFDPQKKVIYFTGGKQGAHILNEVVLQCLDTLLSRYNVIHQCGSANEYLDFEKLALAQKKMPKDLQKRYVLQKFFSEDEIGTVMKISNIIVSRAGANIITELLFLGKVALLIPLPTSPLQEQEKNAEMLLSQGHAKILWQEHLSPTTLLSGLEEIELNYQVMASLALNNAAFKRNDAAVKILEIMKQLTPSLFG